MREFVERVTAESDKVRETQIISDIREAIEGERLLVVVGAGASKSATNDAPASCWDGLLKLGLETLPADDPKQVGLPQLLTGDDPKSAIHVAEVIEDTLGGRSDFVFRCWLRDTVGSLRPVKRDVLEAIRDLHVPVVTTNYDNLLEEVLDRTPITFDDTEDSLGFVRGENVQKTILHMHGHYQKPRSIVFGTRSYSDLLNTGYAEAILRALAIRYTWLFIGFGKGMQDPHFREFTLWMEGTLGNRIPWHYQLLTREEAAKTQIRGRIRPLIYGNTHDRLAPFLGRLIRSSTTRLRPASGEIGGITPGLELCTGRESELRAFRRALLEDYPKPIAILGGPGLGKTAFCAAAFNFPEVEERYKERRFYVRMDAATSTDAMLRAIALRLRLQPPAALAGSFSDRTSRNLLSQIVDELRRDRTLLVLDGVDTAWHEYEPDAETCLAKLYESAADCNFAMVAVLTGYRRPLKVPWGLRIDLTPLRDEESSRLFIEVSRQKEIEKNLYALKDSDALQWLIRTLDGIPLAIKIMASTAAFRVHENKKGKGGTRADWDYVLSQLREEWQQKRYSFPKPYDSIALRPLFSLWVSLRVALAEDGLAEKLLALMGLLPDGVHATDLSQLRKRYPDIPDKLDDLKRRDIVFEENSRERLEPPIWQFAHEQLTANDELKQAIVSYFLEKAVSGEAIGWGKGVDGSVTSAIKSLKAEANNIEALIRDELKRGNSERAIRSALALGRFYRFAGVAGDHKIVKEALIASQQLAGDDGRGDDDKHELVAECYRVLGSMKRLCCPDIEDAQNPYNKASEWYKKLSDETRMLLGLAHCQRARADIETVQADPKFREKTRSHYEAALEQYEKVLHSLSDNNDKDRQRQQAKRGKAYCLAHLGDATHMNATHILRAREADGSDQIVTKAKEFYRMAQETFQAVDVNDAIGVAHCKKGLGDIYCIEPSSNEEPSTFYREAAVLYHKSGYIVGVADCQYSMGDYAFRKPNCVEQARKRMK